MFSWICPQCGKDVPPSKNECPHCAERAREFAAQQAMLQAQQSPVGQSAGYPSPVEQSPQRSGFDAAPQRSGFDAPPQRGAYEPQPSAAPRPAYDAPPPQQRGPYEPPPQGRSGYDAPLASPGGYDLKQPGGGPVKQQGDAPPQYEPAHRQPPPQSQSYGGPPQQAGPWSGQQFPPPPPGHQPQPMLGQSPHWAPSHQKSGPPTWLLSVAFALAILGIGAAVYFGVQHFGKSNPQEKAGLENPANPSKAKVSNPLQKYVEVVGIRLMGDAKKRPIARFVVVNHSSSQIEGLAANVTLWASTSRSEEDSVASFSFRLPRLGPNESREITESLKTKLKLYELPDWQNANAEIQITAP